jgi:micrococcal nuclease
MKHIFHWLIGLCLVLTACAANDQPSPNGEMTAVVKRVVDGDTFEISSGEKVRMIGVDTPETVKPNHPVEPYGKEASEFSKKLLTGQTVTLKFDVEPHDRYGRLLAYVYMADGTFVNEKLVRDGYARIMTVPPNVAYADLFLEAERDAREHNRGLWGLSDSQTTSTAKEADNGKDSNTKKAKQTDSAAETPPPGKPIKGNINAKGEKIYHVPGSANYERTKAEVWFATEEEAKAAGFRPPKR